MIEPSGGNAGSVATIAADGVRKFHAGDLRGSIRDFSRVLKLRPGDAGVLLWRASCYRALREPRRAWSDLRAARGVAPASAAVRVAFGALLGDGGRFAAGLKECEAAVGLEPSSASARELRGDLSLAMGEKTQALRAYEEAFGLAPSAALSLKAALVLRDLGYIGLALAECRKARRLDPGLERARTLRTELAQRQPGRSLPGRRRRGLYPDVRVEPRLELLWVALTLAGADGRATIARPAAENRYASLVLKRFRPFRRHPAVFRLEAALKAGLSLIGAQRSMLDLSGLPELLPRRPHVHVHRPELLESLRDFARDSDFERFLADQEPFFRECRVGVESQVRRHDYAGLMEEYSGSPVSARYTLELCPLMPQDGSGRLNFVGWEPGRAEAHIHSTVGPARFHRGIPRFDFPALRWSLWHEWGHSLLDAFLEKHRELADETERLFAGTDGRYGHWPQTVREHVVQGLATRMLAWAHETGRTSDPSIEPDLGHLPYAGAIVERLKEYERSRRRYRSLTAFYPRLLDVFRGLPAPRRAKRRILHRGVDAIV